MVRPNPALLASGTYHMAETDDGAVVGCGGWTRERPGTRDMQPSLAHIRHFATRAERAGRGVGRAIYCRREAQAFAAGVTSFECYASLNAEGFYAALGFAVVGRFDVPLGESLLLPSVVMRRSLASTTLGRSPPPSVGPGLRAGGKRCERARRCGAGRARWSAGWRRSCRHWAARRSGAGRRSTSRA